jgi:hypothetical protein
MVRGASTLVVLLLLVTSGFAKDKNKSTLPAYVLRAHFVAVIIDPDAGISIENPRANENAQKDVEAALLNWGRFSPTLATQAADLIIVVRKGNGHLINDTIPDPRQNNRAGVMTPGDNGVSMGGQHGPQQPGMGSNPESPHPQTEIGEVNDSFVVYEGGVENPLSSPPAWRYVAQDGLSPGTVPAVAAFKKAVADAEKAAAKAAGKTP